MPRLVSVIPGREDMRTIEASLRKDAAVTQGPVSMSVGSRLGSGLLKAVSDGPSTKILESVIARGRSIEEICSETNVPVSTTYRRIHELTDDGIIIIERVVITADRRRHVVYRAAFSKVKVEFEPEDCRVEGTPNERVPDIIYRLWQFARNHPDDPSVRLG